MADIRSGGAFVEVTAKDSTKTGLDAVKANLNNLAKTAKVSGADLSKGLAAGLSGVVTLNPAKLKEAGANLSKAFSTAFTGGLKAIGGIASGILQASFSGLVKAAPIALVGIMTAISVGVVKAFGRIDAASKAASNLGIDPGVFAGLQHGANLAGVSAEALQKSLKKLIVDLDQIASTGKGAEAFERLGLSAKELATLPVDKALGKIADGLQGVKDPAERSAISMQIFGKAGVEMGALLADGSKGIGAAVDEAKRLGIAFSGVDGKAIEAANDAVDTMKESFNGVFNAVAIKLAPAISQAAAAVTDFVASGRAAEIIVSIIEGVVKAVLFSIAVWDGLRAAVVAAAGGIIVGLGMMGEAISEVLNLLPGVKVQFGSAMRAMGNEVLKEAGRIANQSASEFERAMDFKLPPNKLEVSVTGTKKTADELLAAAAAAKTFQDALTDADTKLKELGQSDQQKKLASVGKAYDDLIAKVNEAAESVVNAGSKEAGVQAQRAAAAKVAAIEEAKFAAVAKESAALRAKGEEATQKAIQDSARALANLTPTDPITDAVRDAEEKYQAILDKLTEGLKTAQEDLAGAADDAASKSAEKRKADLVAQIQATQAAAIAGADRAFKAGEIAAQEQAIAIRDAQQAVVDAMAEAANAGGIGKVGAVQGGFDTQALAAQAVLGAQNPTVDQLKQANEKLEKSQLALAKIQLEQEATVKAATKNNEQNEKIKAALDKIANKGAVYGS